jgi:hypothetical protein
VGVLGFAKLKHYRSNLQMKIQEVTTLQKKGQRKPPNVQMKSTLKDVATFEEDGTSSGPNVI